MCAKRKQRRMDGWMDGCAGLRWARSLRSLPSPAREAGKGRRLWSMRCEHRGPRQRHVAIRRGGAVRGKAYPTGVRLTEIEMVNHAEKLRKSYGTPRKATEKLRKSYGKPTPPKPEKLRKRYGKATAQTDNVEKLRKSYGTSWHC